MKPQHLVLIAVSLGMAACCVGGIAQSAALPDAPPAPVPSATPLVLPKLLPGHAEAPAADKEVAPPVKADEETWCAAPSDSGWRSSEPVKERDEFEVSRYLAAIDRKIHDHWKLPLGSTIAKDNTKVQIRFTLSRDGGVLDPVVMMSSGRKLYDKSALESLLKSSPFAPLPAGLQKPLRVCMVFIYNPYQKSSGPTDPWAAAK